MQNLFVLTILFSLLLAACGPAPSQIETAIAQTEAARPTNTAQPTDTPQPTITPTPDPCPHDAALLYNAKAIEQMNLMSEAMKPMAITDTTIQAAAYVEVLKIKDTIDQLEGPQCAKDALLELKAFAKAAADAGEAIVTGADDKNEKLEIMTLIVGHLVEAHQKFQEEAGIQTQ